MKIISKYKDVYDYLTGIYGEDPLLILDRREFDINRISASQFYNTKIQLFIDTLHFRYQKNRQVNWTSILLFQTKKLKNFLKP